MDNGILFGSTLRAKKEDEINKNANDPNNKYSFTWDEAVAIAKEHTGWDLPTKEQLNDMYKEFAKGTDKKGGFSADYYWTKDVNPDKGKGHEAFYQNFVNGGKMYNVKSLPARVRLVKTVKAEQTEKPKEHSADFNKLMANESEINVQGWNDWRKNNMQVKPNLRGEIFDNKDLTGVNFSNTDLQMASFKNTNLTNANLKGAIVNGVDFSGANFSGTNVEDVNFKWALNYTPDPK